MAGILVQKFGGTSVGSGDRLSQVAGIVANAQKNSQVIVVVSALSPEIKARGTTSLLLKAAQQSVAGESFDEAIQGIVQTHQQAVSAAISSKERIEACTDFINAEISRVSNFLTALSVIRELTPSSLDNVICAGERLSAFVLSQTLIDHGVDAKYIDLSDVVTWKSIEINSAFFDQVQDAIVDRCVQCNAQVPVLTGYFGPITGGMLENVGRGYTDFTAAMITAGLGKEKIQELQVWKEVDGICTADPRRVSNAQVLREISAIEASELTHFGSEVLHPFTMERVTSAQVPIRVKNTFNPDGQGTSVVASVTTHKTPITAITAKKGITVVTLTSNRMFNTYGFLAQAFDVLRKHGVVVDLVATSEITISFSIESDTNLDKAKRELEKLGRVSVMPKQAILAVVGENIPSTIETASTMFSALAKHKINVGLISKGASGINISCIVEETAIEKALPAIHDAFFA